MNKRIKVGFSIACYDKFDEVNVLSDILKMNFVKFDSLICVGSNYSGFRNKFSGNTNIDLFVDGEDIKQTVHSSEARFGLNFENGVISTMRTVSNTNAAVNELLKHNCDYIVTLHSDSWLLNEDKVIEIFQMMEDKNRPFAFRGFNVFYDYLAGPSKTTYLVDFLMFAKADFLREHNIFSFDSYSMLPGTLTNAHSTYFWQIMVKIQLHNCLCYSDTKNLVFWDDKPVYWIKYLAPFCFDKKFEQVHINVGSFFENLGEKLQAMYLKKYQFKGHFIDGFLEKWSVPEEELFSRLNFYDLKYSRKLKWRFSNFELCGLSRSHKYVDNFLKSTSYLGVVKKSFYTRRRLKRNENFNIVDLYKDNFDTRRIPGHSIWHDGFYIE
ncbi:MAG: hypothetical protein HWD84_08330 [Flavobacteriaceae bacterium]|nr:hypothetical protein [Flavobacteriaceae bacterium]